MKITKVVILALPLIMDKVEFITLLVERFCEYSGSGNDIQIYFEHSDIKNSLYINPSQIRFRNRTFLHVTYKTYLQPNGKHAGCAISSYTGVFQLRKTS